MRAVVKPFPHPTSRALLPDTNCAIEVKSGRSSVNPRLMSRTRSPASIPIVAAVSRRTLGHSGLSSDFDNFNFDSRSAIQVAVLVVQPPKHPLATTCKEPKKQNEFKWVPNGVRELTQADDNTVDAFKTLLHFPSCQ